MVDEPDEAPGDGTTTAGHDTPDEGDVEDRGDDIEGNVNRTNAGDEEVTEIGDGRQKHVSVLTKSGKSFDHGEAYLRHSETEFVVSSDTSFPPEQTTRYRKDHLRRIEVTQHHSACFITTAAAGEGWALDALREFRDDALRRSAPGRALVSSYEALSPPVAATLDRHPNSRVTGTVRWLVEYCGTLAARRAKTNRPVVAAGLALLLTLLYVVGVLVALVGHWWLVLAGDDERGRTSVRRG